MISESEQLTVGAWKRRPSMDGALLCPAGAEEQDGTMTADCQGVPTARISGRLRNLPQGAQLTYSPQLGYSSLVVNVCASFPTCHFSESGKEGLAISRADRFPA